MTLTRRLGAILIKAVTLGAPLCTSASDSAMYAVPTAPGDYVRHVMVQGDSRKFRLHIPAGYDASKALPVIFAFHGSSASASVIERETSLNQLADSLGFFVVYPEGFHRGWNVGDCCSYSYVKHKNESLFTLGMLEMLSHGLRVDAWRVYATGYSDGGTLSMLLACNMPQKITAAASVSGTLFEPLPRCDRSRNVPMMVIHGTGDHNIPYEGKPGGSRYTRGEHREHSAPEVAQFWLSLESCGTAPILAERGNVVRAGYECAGGSEVIFFTIRNGAHGWPGGGRGWVFSPRPPNDMVATDTIATFFLRHRIGEVSGR